MGKKIIISGADFSKNGIAPPGENKELFGFDLTGMANQNGNGTGNFTWIFGNSVSKSGQIKSIICRGTASTSGEAIIKIFNPPSGGYFTQVGNDVVIPVNSNEKMTLAQPISISAGQYIGYKVNGISIWYNSSQQQWYANGLVSSVSENSKYATIHSIQFEIII